MKPQELKLRSDLAHSIRYRGTDAPETVAIREEFEAVRAESRADAAVDELAQRLAAVAPPFSDELRTKIRALIGSA